MNVPAPPLGYWAHVTAKGHGKAKFVRPPLTYTVAERIDEDNAGIRMSLPAVGPKKLDDPLPLLPSIPETQNEPPEEADHAEWTLARFERAREEGERVGVVIQLS